MEAPEVKPCLFCKSNAHVVYDYFSYVSCDNCNAYGPEGDGILDSINRWNNGEQFMNLKIQAINKNE